MVERRWRIALLYISTHVVVVVVVAFFHQMLGKTTLLQRPAAPSSVQAMDVVGVCRDHHIFSGYSII